MPLYEYECSSCHKRSEVIQSFNDPPLRECPLCGGEVRKLLSAPAFQFKGTGWYVTDYAGKKAGGDEKESKGSAAKSDGAAAGGGEKPAASPANGEATAKSGGKSSSDDA